MPGAEIVRVTDGQAGLYGREHGLSHQEIQLANRDIVTRSRSDLPERCLHWLRAVLRYKRPPGRVLEIGSAQGGFAGMLRWAGFEATGLEINPWAVGFARDTLQVPVLLGPVEEQQIAPASLDVISLMDALEHFRDPLASMRHCLSLLKPDGVLVIQTPRYPEGSSLDEMAAASGGRREILQPGEHLYLFSHRSIRDFFRRLGADHIAFEPAVFAEYDMFLVVSRAPLKPSAATDVDSPLSSAPAARMAQALLDLGTEIDGLKQRYAAAEEDHARRLGVIEDQGRRLGEAEAERNQLRAVVTALRGEREVVEADRATRLEVIREQGRRLGEMEAERKSLRLEAQAQREQMQVLMAQLRGLQQTLQQIEGTRVYRWLRALGRWKFMDEVVAERPTGSSASSYPQITKGPDGRATPKPDSEQNAFDESYAKVREPKKLEGVWYPQGAEDRIVGRLLALGFDVRDYEVDVADYQHYVSAARYVEEFPDYYPFNRPEKALEHYLAAKLLELREEDVYVDVASEHSPVADIYHRLFGVAAYRQDLAFPAGVEGDRIGGDAAHMPVPDGFATKMSLHCSFEHFEGDGDIGFVREAGRVLRPGSAMCVVPLYLSEEYAIQVDPVIAVWAGVAFDDDATVYCAKGWANRHGRLYDPEHLARRILANAAPGMTLEIYQITNAEQVDPSCYARFAMLIRKPH